MNVPHGYHSVRDRVPFGAILVSAGGARRGTLDSEHRVVTGARLARSLLKAAVVNRLTVGSRHPPGDLVGAATRELKAVFLARAPTAFAGAVHGRLMNSSLA